METAIERMTAIAFLVVSISHIIRPQGWVQFFAQLRERGEPGAFINGMMSLALGTLIVGFHGTQWTGWAAVVTFIGWGQVLKGVVNLCFPALALRSMGQVPAEKAWKFVAGGALMLPIGAGILLSTLRG